MIRKRNESGQFIEQSSGRENLPGFWMPLLKTGALFVVFLFLAFPWFRDTWNYFAPTEAVITFIKDLVAKEAMNLTCAGFRSDFAFCKVEEPS
jgi:hypothetical protein